MPALVLKLLIIVVVCCSGAVVANAQDPPPHVQTVEDPELANLVSVAITADDRFVYAAGFDPGALVCLSRDAETGKLTKVHSYPVSGMISVDVSADQQQVVAGTFQSNELFLFDRDVETGALEQVAVISGADHESLRFPVSVKFSPEGKHVYATCGASGKLLVLEITEEGLELIQEHAGEEDCLGGCRIVALTPKGDALFIASKDAGTVTIYRRDLESGKVKLVGHIMDDSIYAALLEGAHGLDVGPDGKYLYVTSGRFSGDDAVSVFQIKDNFKLKMIQEFENGVELEGFTGGNHVGVSRDGLFAYATGATSETVACFRRAPDSGKLTFLSYLTVNGNENLGMTAGVCGSHDGRSLYVAGESNGVIYVFHRQKDESPSPVAPGSRSILSSLPGMPPATLVGESAK